jgi:D-amino-acid dehydrogenase
MSKRIVIIGAGVIGLSVAHACARAGARVTLLERNGPVRNGCSYGNLGMVVPSHFVPLAAPGMVALGLKWMWNPESPFYIKPRLSAALLAWGVRFWSACTPQRVAAAAIVLRDLHMLSREVFRELDAEGMDFGLEQKGLLMLCKTRHGLDEEASTAARARELGIPAEVLDAKQTAAVDPGITMNVAGAVYFPKDCHLQPERYLAALQNANDSLGVECVWNAQILDWSMEKGVIRSVRTGDGDISGDEFVVCGGVWSEEIARPLRLSLPMQAGKGYTLTLAKPPELPTICSIFTEARVAVTPMGGSLRFGGTMEIAGLNEAVTARRVRGIVKAVSEYYPAFAPSLFEGLEPWSGLRPCSPDGLPYLGRTRRWRNLTVATGHAMMGLSLAPVTGRIVAQILHGETPSCDLRLLSPDRYA